MGCRVCRARKVKCDGRPNGCRNCERLQLECVGENGVVAISTSSLDRNSDGAASQNGSAASTNGRLSSPVSLRKIRTYRSCTACRLSKTKCDGGRPHCARCTLKKLPCVYDGGSAPRWTRNLTRDGKKGEGVGDERENGDATFTAATTMDEDGMEESPDGSQTGNGRRPSTISGQISSFAATPISRNSILDTPDTLSWLLSPDLPSPRHIRRLVEHYFSNIHPIRCFAFVHKPSFMRQLDNGFTSDDEAALLHVICAHGAKFHYLSLGQIDQVPNLAFVRVAGNQWAKKAESLLLNNYGKITTQKLMTAVLLYDFRYRLGEYSEALMLSGMAVRMAQALKINTEYSPDILCTEGSSAASAPSVVSRESRRRLMWAVYVLDAWTGSGNEQLTLLRESDIKIQLPCNERNFGLRIPSVTETLGVGHVLQFLSPAAVPARPADNMGIMAYYIRIVTLWKRIVKYIHQADRGPPPWLPESDFAALDADMGRWRRELPDFVEYSPDTIYARLDSNQLGGLVLIHCTYHHSYLELYKVSMPELFRLAKTHPLVNGSSFPTEHAELLQALQADCYFHALQVSRLLSEAAEHGARLLSDSMLPFFVLDSSRVMIYYVARLLDLGRVDYQDKVEEAMRAVEVNLGLLRIMAPLFPASEALYATVERWLLKIRHSTNTSSPRRSEDSNGMPSVEMMTIVGSPTNANPELGFSQLTLPNTSRSVAGASDNPTSDPPQTSRSTSWTAANTTTTSSPRPGEWDQHASAAHQLVGLSQNPQSESSLQHERPVPTKPTITGAAASTVAPMPAGSGAVAAAAVAATRRLQQRDDEEKRRPFQDALDLEELQNFLSWDIHGIMDLGETISASGGYDAEDARRSEWSSVI